MIEPRDQTIIKEIIMEEPRNEDIQDFDTTPRQVKMVITIVFITGLALGLAIQNYKSKYSEKPLLKSETIIPFQMNKKKD